MFVQVPIVPVDRVVLTVSVVIALLGTADFISSGNHRRACGKQKRCQQIPFLSLAVCIQFRIVRRTLHSVIATVVAVVAVMVVLSVCFIVLVLVGDQILKCEPVVTGDVVDA